MTGSLGAGLLTIVAAFLAVAVVGAFRWYERQADGAVHVARHARRVAVEQEAREAEPGLRVDPGVRQRMLAGRIDAGQPIPSGWRWVLVLFAVGLSA